MLSTAFYAGVRMGELRDLSWRNVDFTRSMIRVESGIARGERTSPKGKRARSIPLVSVLAERLMPLADRQRFTAGHDYVFCNDMGERVGERALRAVFYDALARAGFADKRSPRDPARQCAEPDTRPRPSALLLHMGRQRLADHERPELRRPPRHQDDHALCPPPDE